MLQLILTVLLAQMLILLAIRPLILWYFGIERMTKILESIDLSLKQLPAVQAYRGTISQQGKKVA